MYYSLAIIGLILSLFYFLILNYARIGLKKLKDSKNQNDSSQRFSIIIPCRNEEKNLPELIKSLEKIRYSKDQFEIIFINDRSTDNTLDIILKSKNQLNNVKVINQKDLIYKGLGKKSAIQRGIEEASFEIILTIDADCIVPELLLELYKEQYQQGYDVVAGPVFFKNYKLYHAFLNMQSLDYLSLMVMSAGAIGQKNPLICSGANFSYKKDCFKKVGGFSKISKIASGDDDMLLHLFKNESFKINFLWNSNASVITNAQESLKSFLVQRIRWGSKGAKYDDSFWKYNLYIIYFFHFFIFLSALLTFTDINYLKLFCTSIILKIIIDLPLAIKTIKFSRFKGYYLWLIPTLIMQVPYVSIIGILSNLLKPKWK